jgi:endonuclease/exonuclease/phosphatase family metal-dependent hydrolase
MAHIGRRSAFSGPAWGSLLSRGVENSPKGTPAQRNASRNEIPPTGVLRTQSFGLSRNRGPEATQTPGRANQATSTQFQKPKDPPRLFPTNAFEDAVRNHAREHGRPNDNPKSESGKKPERLRVMSYNVHGGQGGPGSDGSSDEELDRLARVIRTEKPDVLMMQEVDRGADDSDERDIVREIADRTGARDHVWGAPGEEPTQGVAVLTFGDAQIKRARNVDFPATITNEESDAPEDEYSHPRNAVDALITTKGGHKVRVGSTHLGWGGNSVQTQVAPLARSLAEEQRPTIFGGDFNTRADDPGGTDERRWLRAAGLRDAFSAVGLKPGDPRRASVEGYEDPADLDRIYASNSVDVNSMRVIHGAGNASDHLPIVADLTIQGRRLGHSAG